MRQRSNSTELLHAERKQTLRSVLGTIQFTLDIRGVRRLGKHGLVFLSEQDELKTEQKRQTDEAGGREGSP